MTEPIVTFHFDGPEGGTVFCFRLCPDCRRYIKAGKVFVNGLGEVSFKDWFCKHCNQEVRPEWGWQEWEGEDEE